MNKVIQIGHNDLRLLLRHKGAYVWLFGVPLLFIYFVGLANRGWQGPTGRNLKLVVQNSDQGPLGRLFCELLEGQGISCIGPNDSRPNLVRIQIPEDFTSKILSRHQTKVGFIRPARSSEAENSVIEARLIMALITINGYIIQVGIDPNRQLTSEHIMTVATKTNVVTLDSKLAGRRPVPVGFYFSLPGTMVMYLLMNILIFGGSVLAEDRRSGVIKRLLAWPISRLQLVWGKVYGLILLGIIQILFFLLAGKFIFRVNIGSNLLGVVLILLAFSSVAASGGVLIGSLSTRQDRISGLCVLVSLSMAAFGGCWWPLEVVPPILRQVAMFLPTGWAVAGLHQLISLGGSLGSVIRHLAILIGFGAVANLVAMRLFRP